MKMEMTAVARHDQALLDKIEEYLEKTRQDREDLAKMRESETNAKRELEAAQKELTSLHEENNGNCGFGISTACSTGCHCTE